MHGCIHDVLSSECLLHSSDFASPDFFSLRTQAPVPLNNERIQSAVLKRQDGESNTNNIGLQSLLQRSDTEVSVIDKRGFLSSFFGSSSKE